MALICANIIGMQGVGAPRTPNRNCPSVEDSMAKKPLPSRERLMQLLDYDPATGKFLWRHCEKQGRRWNTKCAGKPAMAYDNGNGYLAGKIDGQKVYAHRAAYKIHYDVEPEYIDHINGDRSDNRIENLRSVSVQENMRNMRRMRSNTSGIMGVHWYKAYKMWAVYIGNKPRKHLGYFHCIAQAIQVRKKAEREHGYHENHGRRTAC